MKEKKYNLMDAVETVWKSQKGRPENYIILSSEQIERLEKGESEFEMGVSAVPIITREEYLKKKNTLQTLYSML